MLIGLIKDDSAKYDGYNWHDEYARHFSDLGDRVEFLDFKRSDWQEQIGSSKADALLWRAWHRPDDRDDAKNKIFFIDQVIGKRIFPSWRMYQPYDNKIAQLFLMRKYEIPHPETRFFRNILEAKEFAERAKYPLISKCSEGACGDNVLKIENKEDMIRRIEEAFSDEGLVTHFPWVRQKGYVYLQEYLPIERDMRIIVVGEEPVYSGWYKGMGWKNFGEGTEIDFKGIPAEAKKLCVDSIKKMGFEWAAFDIAQYNGRLYVFEFSSIFGFSFKEPLMKKFGSPNAHVLRRQVEHIHKKFL